MPPGVEGNSPGVISDLGPGAALEAEAGAQQDPEQWDQDDNDAEEMADFEEAHRYSRGTASGAEADAQGRGGTRTSDTATAEEDATHRAGGVGERGAPLSQVQLLTTRAMQNPRETELDTLSQRACALIPTVASSGNSASFPSARLQGSAPMHAQGDTGRPALTRLVGTQARDR